MSQKTNLNINPYYDDFDASNNFYKVLFKPGYPVQSRELTTLQSIFQNQIKDFASHIFKDGSMVVPGNIEYDNEFFSVKLNKVHLGVDISLYVDKFVGKTISGESSGITARVQKVVFPADDPQVNDITLYVKYLNSDVDFSYSQFLDGESLVANDNVVYGNTTITSGVSFATLVSTDATSIASSVSIGEGIYFIRGHFVNVSTETLVLDYYNNDSSYKVGFDVKEELITAKDDTSLYDNARGFSNYASPGADRLKITTKLVKKTLSSKDNPNFIELIRIRNGKVQKIKSKTEYNQIRDYFAQRTFEESGNYTLNPFDISLHNSLNNGLGNDGIYFQDEITSQGNNPSEELLGLKVGPGKAYVKGYDIDHVQSIIDVEKPRDTQSVKTSPVYFEMGNLLRVNNVVRLPQLKKPIQLHSNIDGTEQIGDARVYSFNLTDSAYVNQATSWDLRLFDIQTWTKLTVNINITSSLNPSYFVEGKNSGASGYVVTNTINSTDFSLTQTSGSFQKGEQLIVNGIDSSVIVTEITVYKTQDIKSVKQIDGDNNLFTGGDFTADCILDSSKSLPGTLNITSADSGISTVTSPGNTFSGLSINDIIKYQIPGSVDVTHNRVSEISNDLKSIEISGITTVPNVFDGGLQESGSSISVNGSVVEPTIRGKGVLYAPLFNSNVSEIDLSSSSITVIDQIGGNNVDSNGTITVSTTDLSLGGSVIWENFDQENYTVAYSNGDIVPLSSDTVEITTSGNAIFKNLDESLSSDDTVINITAQKSNIKSKKKEYSRSRTLYIRKSKLDQSGSNTNSTIADGLTTSDVYGVRVQDKEISLNVPDAVKVLAVYESLNSADPILDKVSFDSASNVADRAIIGENIRSTDNKKIARVVSKNGTTLDVVYLTDDKFTISENVSFDESNIIALVQSITNGVYKNITESFNLDKGQKDEYYDYSKLVRRKGVSVPSKRLMVIYDYYKVSPDGGDLFTINSYDGDRFLEDIPNIGKNSVRASDTLDFRPRVAEKTQLQYNALASSPLHWSSRSFGSDTTQILAPDKGSSVSYDFYLPRIDRVYMDYFGNVVVDKGVSSSNPKAPSKQNEFMELARITYPAYLYSPKDAIINLIDNRRYTMRDIGYLEERIETLEEVTSLSLLELNTKSLQIQDSDGKDRFKSGFFVDDFKDSSRTNAKISSAEINTNSGEISSILSRNSLESLLATSSNITPENLDLSDNLSLLDPKIQKTGKIITLAYDEVDWLEQPNATRVENVNPFNVILYEGSVELTPTTDNWVRTIQLADRSVSASVWGGWGWTTVSTTVTNNLLSRTPEIYMRSRNTQFEVSNLKPSTRYYQFLDNNSGVDFIPKLLEISPDETLQTYGASSSFDIGETVVGYIGDEERIRFRLCSPGHKTGTFNNPTTFYGTNPYTKESGTPQFYSTTSKYLNVDTFSLCQQAQGLYFGYVTVGMRLEGQTSGAQCYVKDLRLISDETGDLNGSFFLRNPYVEPAPSVRIETGTKEFKLTSSPTNEKPLPGSTLISSAETNYVANGTLEIWQRTISTIVTVRRPRPPRRGDPLAQTFTVGGNIAVSTDVDLDDDANGVFLTSVDLYFGNIDPGSAPLRVEIRTVQLGTPTLDVIGTPVIVHPRSTNSSGNLVENIKTSSTGDVPTNIKFKEPIFLAPGQEYALVIISESSDQYELWTAVMDELTVGTTDLPDVDAVKHTQQFALGSLFKSQNGSIWTTNQFQDLKFKLYKAKFKETNGSVYFYNPPLDRSNGYVQNLAPESIETLPKTGKIVVQPTIDSNLTIGRKITTNSSINGFATIVGTGGSATTINTVSAGVNYPSSVTGEIVSTNSIIGNGSGLKLVIDTDADGVITGAAVSTDQGTGYKVGDVVGIQNTATSTTTGRDAEFTITGIGNVDTLYLSNIQGQISVSGSTFAVGAGVSYYDDNGNITQISGLTIESGSEDGGVNSGNYIKVNHFDHGMYSATNKVKLNGIKSNIPPTTLSVELPSTANSGSNLTIADASEFQTFEGLAVDTNNPGYLKVNGEIIEYTLVSGNVLNIEQRGIDNTTSTKHSVGSLVEKYEINGVSLRRINGLERDIQGPIGIDEYYLEIDRNPGTLVAVDRSTDTASKPQLSFNSNDSVGGTQIYASKNIIYSGLRPTYDVFTPGSSTSVNASIRSVTGTSVDGTEPSFNDVGFESVELNEFNQLDSTRIVCSEENQNEYLTGLPRSKSFTTLIEFNTTDHNLSPVLHLDTAFTEFFCSRLNSPVSNYVTDRRVNSIEEDPHSSVYYTNLVSLKNPATSLKVVLSAYKHESADIRVLYKLGRKDSGEVEQQFELFPGYDNLNFVGGQLIVVDQSKNSGLPDVKVPDSTENEFLDYEFTVDNLDLFDEFTIKVIMSGSDQSKPVIIKDFRAVATR